MVCYLADIQRLAVTAGLNLPIHGTYNGENAMRKSLMTLVSSTTLIAGLAFVAPAFAEDEILQKLKVVSSQEITLDDQMNIGVQWAEADYGNITENLEQLNGGVISDVSAEVEISDCNCFNDITQDINVESWQSLNMDDQINGGLQVALTAATINLDMSQTNVGALSSVGASIKSVAP